METVEILTGQNMERAAKKKHVFDLYSNEIYEIEIGFFFHCRQMNFLVENCFVSSGGANTQLRASEAGLCRRL